MTRGESTRKRTSVSYSEQGEGEEDQDEVSSTRSGRKTIKRKPQVEQEYSDEEEDKYVEGESIPLLSCCRCCSPFLAAFRDSKEETQDWSKEIYWKERQTIKDE